MTDMSTFRITYDGPALETSEMDVRQLAPALLAVGDLLEAATLALHGDRIKPRVDVRGSFKTGSFGIDFNLAADWASRIKDILAGDGATATANALAILGALGWGVHKSTTGLFAVLRWLRNRPIRHVELQEHAAVLHVEGEQLSIELQVLTLLRDVSVRNGCAKVLEPLKQPGITSFTVGDDSGQTFQSVSLDELACYDAPTIDDELLVDDERKMVFSIVSLAFKDDNKWRLHDGAATIHATISDTDFLAKVDASQVNFAKGDMLVCKVRIRQWQTAAGAKTDYDVLHVLDHRTPGRQLPLPGV